MTERQGLFPPDVNDTMTRHWLQSPTGSKHQSDWGGENWWIDGTKLPPWAALEAGWTYLGPAATYEQAQADAADARRFRWLLDNHSYSGRRSPYAHGVDWFADSSEDDIRAAIDAAMKEQGDG